MEQYSYGVIMSTSYSIQNVVASPVTGQSNKHCKKEMILWAELIAKRHPK